MISGTYYDRNYANSKEQTGTNLNSPDSKDLTNCNGNQKEKHFFPVFEKYAQLIQPTLNTGIKKILLISVVAPSL